MCLAGALLRVPDKLTADRLISDKLGAPTDNHMLLRHRLHFVDHDVRYLHPGAERHEFSVNLRQAGCVAAREMEGHQLLDGCRVGDLGAGTGGEVAGALGLVGVFPHEGSLAEQAVSSLRQRDEAVAIDRGIGKVCGVDDFLALGYQQYFFGQFGHGLFATIGCGDDLVQLSIGAGLFQHEQPAAVLEAQLFQPLAAHFQGLYRFPGVGQDRGLVIEFHGSNKEVAVAPEDAFFKGQVSQALGGTFPSGHAKTSYMPAVPLANLEARPAVFHPVPENAAHHARDLIRQPRWAVEAAWGKVADACPQKPQEAADVVGMRMADEYVADLVRYPGGEAPRIPQVEQQVAPLVHQFQPQKRITADAVDQGSAGRANAHHGYRAAGAALVQGAFSHGVCHPVKQLAGIRVTILPRSASDSECVQGFHKMACRLSKPPLQIAYNISRLIHPPYTLFAIVYSQAGHLQLAAP